MADSLDGFALGLTSSDISSPEGKRYRQLLVIARILDEASEIARQMMPSVIVTFESRGLEILAAARKLGVGDRDAKIYDPGS
jgi:hypothetical protein